MSISRQLTKSFLEQYRCWEFWAHACILCLLIASIWPIASWTVEGAQDHSRLMHAIIVLLLAIAALIRFNGIEIINPLRLNPPAMRALIVAYGLLILQWVARALSQNQWHPLISILSVPAYCCTIAASIRFILGEGTTRITTTAAGTLCGFIILSQLMQPLDWPLRHLAGEWSATGLSFIGKQVKLGLAAVSGNPPKLILTVDQHPFHVASECNGFGSILTGVLIGLLLALHQRAKLFDICLNIFAGFVIGFAFNILRIITIILLAPAMMPYYMLMHEIVGGITYWVSIISIWMLLKGPTPGGTEKNQPQMS